MSPEMNPSPGNSPGDPPNQAQLHAALARATDPAAGFAADQADEQAGDDAERRLAWQAFAETAASIAAPIAPADLAQRILRRQAHHRRVRAAGVVAALLALVVWRSVPLTGERIAAPQTVSAAQPAVREPAWVPPVAPPAVALAPPAVALAAADAAWDDGLGQSVGRIRRSLARPAAAAPHRAGTADGIERRIQSLEVRLARERL